MRTKSQYRLPADYNCEAPITPIIMPAFATSCSLIYVLLMAGAVNVIVTDPSRNDMVAALGSLFAAAIVVFDFQSKTPSHRKLSQFMPVFIACGVVGSIGPGLTVQWFFHEAIERITWHAWAGMGFAYGLSGWVIVKYALKLFSSRLPDVIDNLLPKWASRNSRDGKTEKLDP